jgi:hypothetical protein
MMTQSFEFCSDLTDPIEFAIYDGMNRLILVCYRLIAGDQIYNSKSRVS